MYSLRGNVRGIAAALIVLLGALLVLISQHQTPAGAAAGDNTNSVEFWCPDGGIKYDNLSDPTFTVPPAPDGQTYTKAIVKAGSTDIGYGAGNDAPIANPVAGQVLTHSTGKDISHVILCFGPATTTPPTTTSTSTSSTPPTTTSTSTSSTPPTTTSTSTSSTPPTTTSTSTSSTPPTTTSTSTSSTPPTTTSTSTSSTPPSTSTPPKTTSTVTTPAATPSGTSSVLATVPAKTLASTGASTNYLLVAGIALLLVGGLLLAGTAKRTI